MKIIPVKHLLQNNASLAIVSLFFGYSFWHIATHNHIISTTITVPLCFHGADEFDISAPEKVEVTLVGKRIDLYALDTATLAVHISLDESFSTKHGIIIKESHLFLPHTITLARYKPSNITIQTTKKEKEV